MARTKNKEKIDFFPEYSDINRFDDLNRLGMVRVNYYCLSRNTQELINYINSYNSNPNEFLVEEFIRLFQNYVTSVVSLINITRIVKNKIKIEKFNRFYNARIDFIKSNGCGLFIEEIRTCIFHNKLPIIGHSAEYQINIKPRFSYNFFNKIKIFLFNSPRIIGILEKFNRLIKLIPNIVKNKLFPIKVLVDVELPDEEKYFLSLYKEEMIDYIKSNSVKENKEMCLRYLNKFDERIEIKQVIFEYKKSIDELYNWFFKKTNKIFNNEISAYRNIQNQLISNLQDGIKKLNKDEGTSLLLQ